MPKFNITQIGNRSPATASPFIQQLPDTGEQKVFQALNNFSNKIMQIGENVIASETAESVATAGGEANTQLGALAVDPQLKQMGTSEAVAEYTRRAKEIHSNISGALSPGARQAFNRNWASVSSTAAVGFQNAAITRSIGRVKATNSINLAKAVNSAGNTSIVETNGEVHQKLFDGGLRSIQHHVNTGIYGSEEGTKIALGYRDDFANDAIKGYLLRNQDVDTLGFIAENMVIDDPKKGIVSQLPAPVKKYWEMLDASDKTKFRNQALTNMSRIMGEENKAQARADKEAKVSRKAAGAEVIINVLAMAGGTTDPDIIAANKLYTPSFLKDMVEDRLIDADDAIAAQKIIDGMSDAKTDLVSYSGLANRIYASSEMTFEEQKQEIVKIRTEINAMIINDGNPSRLDEGSLNALNSLIKTAGAEGFKNSPQVIARKSLATGLGVPSGGGFMAQFDPKDNQRNIRNQEALQEFDRRVSREKEDPWKVRDDLWRRSLAGADGRQLDSFVPPRYGPRKKVSEYTMEDFTQVLETAADQLQKKKISTAEYHAIRNKTLQIRELWDATERVKDEAIRTPGGDDDPLKGLTK